MNKNLIIKRNRRTWRRKKINILKNEKYLFLKRIFGVILLLKIII